MMEFVYFVKFQNNRAVDRFISTSMEQFFHDLKEFMLRNNTGIVEWIIRD